MRSLFQYGQRIIRLSRLARLAETLALAFDETALVFQLIHQLRGLVISAVQLLHDLRESTDDIHPALVIDPAVLRGKIHSGQKNAIQNLGIRRDVLVLIIGEEKRRNPDE